MSAQSAKRHVRGVTVAITKMAAALTVCMSSPGIAAAEAATITGEARVVDGDGLKIGPVAIRIHGIDAPEAGQSCPKTSGGSWSCGTEATKRLQAIAGDRGVSCEALDRDGYGRIVARCRVDGIDAAAEMVAAGLAWAYVEYSMDYVAIEERARANARGVWQAKGAEPPWEYRADRWGRAVAEAPGGCPIKGNISSGDERIYHTPWSPWYSRTMITEAKGERWFCDEAEAQAAGWRKAEGR